jgi:integrase
MRRESKSTTGSLVRDRRSKKWQFFWWANGRRHSKTLGSFPTKTAAWNAAQAFRAQPAQPKPTGVPTVASLVDHYRAEKMPTRLNSNRGCESWIRVHILPKWGPRIITDVQARPVELWLDSLALAPKSPVHIRTVLSSLWKFAMWKQDIPLQVNPMTLVTVKDASKRLRQPRSLIVEEFRLLVSHLKQPFDLMAVVCVCFGLRISEYLALKWSDVDWFGGLLRVERGICEQNVDDGEDPRVAQVSGNCR